jgi:hypothetical protein
MRSRRPNVICNPFSGYCSSEGSARFHALSSAIRKSRRLIPVPPKGVGFTDPLSGTLNGNLPLR